MHGQENNPRWLNRRGLAAIFLFLTNTIPFLFGQNSGQKTFASPAEASRALYQAIIDNNEQTMLDILGGDKNLVSTGNDGKDKTEREQFVKKYQEMHRLVHELDGTTVLYVGAENWPFPLPLIKKTGAWHFDSAAGKDEILFRTIGDDEANALRVCRALASPKKARGAEVYEAVQTIMNGNAGPLHGYYFRRLKPAAEGGSYVAYPAEYRVSGVMTFVVTAKDAVYERDLGPDTPNVAASMTNWKAESGWRVSNPVR